MRNKEFIKLLKKNNTKSNSGFTLTELLVGMIMSIFVIGALGFGLMQVLRVTQKGNSETAARNESSRALDFISDEMRRAESIVVDNSLTNIASLTSGSSPTFTALTKDDGSGGTVNIKPSLVLNVPGVTYPIIYTVAPPQGTSPWKGPLVIYRWGPILDSDGTYKSTINSQALVDGVSDANQEATCGGSDVPYKGFFACVVDDDGDSTPGETEDSDGKSITAQLFFTGGTKTADGANSTYSADTKAVARARQAPTTTSASFTPTTMSFRTLNPSFACNSTSSWSMRTDFGESLSNPSNIHQWNHVAGESRQPQPIKISNSTLAITSIPRNPDPDPGLGNCDNSRINNGRETTNPTDPRDFSGNQDLGKTEDWTASGNEDVVAISHLIDFNDPRTFNGDPSTCSSYPCDGTPDGNVYGGGTTDLNAAVKVLKEGSVVPNYGGYDANNNKDLSDTGDQVSLGEFLHQQSPSLADKDISDPNNPIYTINSNLKPDERIIGFEIGHTTNPTTNPGFDLQDNIFIVKSDAFAKKYDKYDGTNTYNPATVN